MWEEVHESLWKGFGDTRDRRGMPFAKRPLHLRLC